MKPKMAGLSRQYRGALRRHLQQSNGGHLRPAAGLGRRAITMGLETLDLARIHEQALISLVLHNGSSAARDALARRAGRFFAEAITPIEKTHRTAKEINVNLS